MDRECNKCIHHTSGMCSSWDCKMQTVEDVKREAREKAITEFAEKLTENAYNRGWNNWNEDYMITIGEKTIDEIAEQLKGE